MTCNCGSLHVQASSVDPTKTTSLRKRFEADFKRRFRKIMLQVNEQVAKHDGFGTTALKTHRKFDFPTNQEKVAGFTSWLTHLVGAELFDGTLAMPRSVAAQNVWMDTYIDTAYRRGMRTAASDAQRAGGKVHDSYLASAFLRPVHADRAGIIYTRAYESLQGITEEMSQQISEVLAEGIADGRHPNVLANRINDRISKIGLTRARLLARTEVIAAHAEAKLNVYEDARIQGVGLQSELLTAGDNLVCVECDTLAKAGPYTLNNARGMLPVHPNCRCTWVPFITMGKDIELT